MLVVVLLVWQPVCRCDTSYIWGLDPHSLRSIGWFVPTLHTPATGLFFGHVNWETSTRVCPSSAEKKSTAGLYSRLQFQKENRDKSSSASDRRTLMWTSSSTDAGCCYISITISLTLSHVNFGHCLLMHFTVDAKKLLPCLELLFFLASESQHSSEPHMNLSPMKQVLKLGHSGTS